jgi:hypothetical protein
MSAVVSSGFSFREDGKHKKEWAESQINPPQKKRDSQLGVSTNLAAAPEPDGDFGISAAEPSV